MHTFERYERTRNAEGSRNGRYRMIQERGGSCSAGSKEMPVPVPGSCHSSGRAAGEFAGHPSGAPPDVARDRNVPDRLHGIDSSPANSRRARKGGKKVAGDMGTRTAALC